MSDNAVILIAFVFAVLAMSATRCEPDNPEHPTDCLTPPPEATHVQWLKERDLRTTSGGFDALGIEAIEEGEE